MNTETSLGYPYFKKYKACAECNIPFYSRRGNKTALAGTIRVSLVVGAKVRIMDVLDGFMVHVVGELRKVGFSKPEITICFFNSLVLRGGYRPMNLSEMAITAMKTKKESDA